MFRKSQVGLTFVMLTDDREHVIKLPSRGQVPVWTENDLKYIDPRELWLYKLQAKPLDFCQPQHLSLYKVIHWITSWNIWFIRHTQCCEHLTFFFKYQCCNPCYKYCTLSHFIITTSHDHDLTSHIQHIFIYPTGIHPITANHSLGIVSYHTTYT